MIKLADKGFYTLIETRNGIKILTLERKKFAWIKALGIGEILVASHRAHVTDHILCCGRYRLYDVKEEDKLRDVPHLELLVGDGIWQGYLLPTGLPTNKKKKKRIIPTQEMITKSS